MAPLRIYRQENDDMVTKSATCCTNPVFVTFTLTYQNLLFVVGSFDKAQKSRFWQVEVL